MAGDDRGQETEYALQREGDGRVGRGRERDREKERRGSLDELALAGREIREWAELLLKGPLCLLVL